MKRVPARSRRPVVVPMRVKARSRVGYSRQSKVENRRQKNLTVIGSLFLLFALVCLSISMLLKALPTWVLPDSDSVFVIAPSNPATNGVFWLLVNRPTHRGSLIVQIPYTPDEPLVSGMFPSLPMQRWAERENQPSDTSQALGVAVDTVVRVPVMPNSRGELLQYARRQAWQALRVGQFDSDWVTVAASLQSGTVVELKNIAMLPDLLDRSDVSLMGDFNACQIAVVNGTTQNGLAAAIGQIIEQSGGQVIRLEGATALATDALQDIDSSQVHILVRPEKTTNCAYATKRLSALFSQASQQESDAVPSRVRADLVVILGEDIQKEALFVTAFEQYPLK